VDDVLNVDANFDRCERLREGATALRSTNLTMPTTQRITPWIRTSPIANSLRPNGH
jgi:hypothetical protein